MTETSAVARYNAWPPVKCLELRSFWGWQVGTGFPRSAADYPHIRENYNTTTTIQEQPQAIHSRTLTLLLMGIKPYVFNSSR